MRFTINIPPEPQRRGKIVRIGKFSRIGRTERQELAEGQLISVLANHRPKLPMTGPLYLQVKAFLPIPKSFSKKKIAEAQGGVLLMPIKTPDLSNLIKHLEDCMTKIGFWEDDCQVVAESLIKRYDDGAGPRWEILLITWDEFYLTSLARKNAIQA